MHPALLKFGGARRALTFFIKPSPAPIPSPMFRQLTKTSWRQFSSGRPALNDAAKVLPSTLEMKSQAWTSANSNDSAITRKVVGMARNLQETSKPPITIAKNFSKTFVAGQTYDPFDFSINRLDMENKWEKHRRDTVKNYRNGDKDVFVRTGIDPLDLYSMPEILSRFVSATGQILPREVTGCTAKNQKRLAIAIKRARSVGLLSTTHRHARYMPKRIL